MHQQWHGTGSIFRSTDRWQKGCLREKSEEIQTGTEEGTTSGEEDQKER